MSGQLLVRPPDAPGRDAPAGAGPRSPTAAASCGSSTSAPSAGWPSTARRRRRGGPCPRRWRTSPATRSTRRSTTTPFVRRLRAPAHRAQARAARPDAGLRRRQHLRRRGAVAGPAALRPADRRRCAGAEAASVLGAARGVHGRGARRRAARRSTRCTSTSTARAATSTASLDVYGREGSRARRCGTPIAPRAVHEPVVVPLPALPAHAQAAAPVDLARMTTEGPRAAHRLGARPGAGRRRSAGGSGPGRWSSG